MNKNIINIFTTADDKYSQHLCVMMASILVNSNKEDNYYFYIFDFDIQEENKLKIEKLKKIHNFNIEYIKITKDILKKIKEFASFASLPDHITDVAYARLTIPYLYPHLDKCLWIDVDVIVNENIFNLYNINIKDNAFGAIQEIWSESENFKINLGINKSSLYINSGILLLNLKKVRKIDILNKLYEIDSVRKIKDQITLGDQDTLNIVFENNIYKLPFKYNMQRSIFEKNGSYLTNFYSKDELIKSSENCKNSGVIHYTGPQKPWGFIKTWINKPVWSLYWYYIKFTPYKTNRFIFLIKSICYEFSTTLYNKKKSIFYKIFKLLIKFFGLFIRIPKYYKLVYRNKK